MKNENTMFSYETEHIIRKIQNRVLGSRDSVSLRLILSAPIHDAIKVYFRASVADKHGSPKRFHSEHSTDIDTLRSEIDLLLPSNVTFSKDMFSSTLMDAVHFQFNYLCRPRWTMKEFFFHNSSGLSIPELKQGFLYFSAYDYYPKVLFRYLHKKNIKQLDRSSFDEITRKIDVLVLGDATPDDYVNLLQPFADFIGYGREDNDSSIPEHALALFFGDKGFNHIRYYLETTLQERNIDTVTLEELHQLLGTMPEGGFEQQTKPPTPAAPPAAEDQITPLPTDIGIDEHEDTQIDAPIDDTVEEDAVHEEEPAEEEINLEEPEPPPAEESIDLLSEIEDPDVDETGTETTDIDEPPVIEEPFEEEPETDADFEQETKEENEKYDETDLFRPIESPEEYTEEEPEEEETPEQMAEPEETSPVNIDDEHEDKTIIEEEFIEDEIIEDEFIEDEHIDEEDLTETEESVPEEFEEPVPDDEMMDGSPEAEEEPKPKRPLKMPSLELMIEDDERKRFIRKLFNGDTAYFNIVIETLNKMTSWKEASLYIDEIFLMNGVDPYSTDSVNFTDKVYTRFSHKSKYK